MLYGSDIDRLPLWLWAVTGISTLVASSQLSLALVNWLTTFPTVSTPLPKMDFSKGIPEGYETLVVIPTMLISEKQIEKLCDNLEVHYLANRDKRLKFCLLTDFVDADRETMPHDAARFTADSLIDELNGKHADDDEGPFLALNRPRKWNVSEKEMDRL